MINLFLSSMAFEISFPGLGIGEFTVDPVAFEIPIPWGDGGSHPVMWYGIIIALAMIAAFFVARFNLKREGMNTDFLYDLAIYLIIFCMIGARLYYVLMSPNKSDYDSFYDIIAVWNGGLAIYGGIIAGAATILVFSKLKKLNTCKLFDSIAPALMLGQAIGRWGNFMNAEAHGGVTELPWRMGIDGVFVHPTFLYESLWNILGFALIMSFYKKKKFDGENTLAYLIWYGVGRFFIEGLRTDSLYIFGDIRVSQAVSVICVIIGTSGIIAGTVRAHKKASNEGDYTEVYSSAPSIPEDIGEASFDENTNKNEEN